MVAAGYVRSTSEAFDRWLGQTGPAFVPRAAVTPEEVIAVIHAAGGLASLAHPGRTRIDGRLPALRDAGLDAIEAFHSDHDARTAAGYADSAQTLGLLVTGGSDFHGDPAHGVSPGAAGLALDAWQRLSAARHRHAAR
jgi:predicted metal-dependent phosphoesterase TrpH